MLGYQDLERRHYGFVGNASPKLDSMMISDILHLPNWDNWLQRRSVSLLDQHAVRARIRAINGSCNKIYNKYILGYGTRHSLFTEEFCYTFRFLPFLFYTLSRTV